MTGAYARPLTPGEWLLLGMGTNVVQHVFEGEGQLHPDALAQAVALASAAAPGTRLVRKGRQWVDSGVPWPVRVLELPDGQDLLGHDALQSTLLEGGPSGEILIVPGSPFRLVFRAFQGVTDGPGLLLWIGDVFRALRGEPVLGATSDLNSEQFGPDEPASIRKPADRPRHPTTMAPVPARSGPRHRLIWRRRTLEAACAAATSRTIAAMAPLTEPGRRSEYTVSVDLRRHRPGLRSTAHLTQSLPLTVEPGADWEEVQAGLLTGLSEHAELASRTPPSMLRLPLPVVRSLHTTIETSSTRKHRYLSSGTITELGPVDPNEHSGGGFRTTTMYALGSLTTAAPPSVDLTTLTGRTELVATWRDGPGAAEKLDELLDVLARALTPAAHRI